MIFDKVIYHFALKKAVNESEIQYMMTASYPMIFRMLTC